MSVVISVILFMYLNLRPLLDSNQKSHMLSVCCFYALFYDRIELIPLRLGII